MPLATVAKPSITRTIGSDIKQLVLSDQTLGPNFTPTYPVSQHPRQIPHPPNPGYKLTCKVELV